MGLKMIKKTIKNYLVNIYLPSSKENVIITLNLTGRELSQLKSAYNDKKVLDLGQYIIDMSKVIYIAYRGEK